MVWLPLFVMFMLGWTGVVSWPWAVGGWLLWEAVGVVLQFILICASES